ncbi:MAG: hypothetical protein IKB02_05810 [Clostridia bacterium]|nr:hypothetical protein [Clostridia bacterium]
MNRYTIRGYKYGDTECPMSKLQDLENKIEDKKLVETKRGDWIITENGCVITCPECIEEIKTLNLLLEDITVDKVLFTSDGEAIDVITVSAVEPTATNQLANILYAKGYRKASDVARETVEAIKAEARKKEQYVNDLFGYGGYVIATTDLEDIIRRYMFDTYEEAELKKKYESEDTK